MGGHDVWLLQRLMKLGHLEPGNTTGAFYGRTLAAVVKFQNSNGIAPIGIVGPKTRAALEKLLPNY